MMLWLCQALWTCLIWYSSHCLTLFYGSCFPHENFAKNMNNLYRLIAASMLNYHCLKLCWLQKVLGLIQLSSMVVHKDPFNEMRHGQKQLLLLCTFFRYTIIWNRHVSGTFLSIFHIPTPVIWKLLTFLK